MEAEDDEFVEMVAEVVLEFARDRRGEVGILLSGRSYPDAREREGAS